MGSDDIEVFLLLVSDLSLIPQRLPEHFASSYLIPTGDRAVLVCHIPVATC